MMLRKGIVVDTHPEDHSVDLVMADDGSRLVGVQVLAYSASTRTGLVDMPKVPPKGDKWDITQRTEQDQLAIVGFVGRFPVVLGFLYPQVNQMLFEDKELRIERHQSDVVHMIDGDGNIDIRHPSGFAIRIGETPDHQYPKKGNYDESLEVDRNVERKPYIRLTMADGTAQLTIAPDGAVTLTTQTTIDVKADGDIAIESGTHITMRAPRIDLNP